MQEVNKFKLGLFVIAAIFLFVVAIACMGIFDQLKPKAQLVTFVSESVQGLANGSDVKYKGVPIGKVDDISIMTENQTIRIDISINLSSFRRKTDSSLTAASSITRQQFYDYLQSEVEKGLTCRIEPDGITGSKYIEMDFFKDTEKKPKTLSSGLINGVYHMPSTPSMMANLRMNLFEILVKIASIDFHGISTQLISLLNTANKTILAVDVESLVNRANEVANKLETTVNTLNTTITPAAVNKTMGDINNALVSVKTLSDNLNKITENSEVPATTASIRHLSDSLKNSSNSLQISLQKLNDAIDAVTDLVLYLNDNPSSVIRGKRGNTPKQK